MSIKLIVFFEEPFWVGVFERIHGDTLETSKIVFGAEPKDYEVYNYIIQNFNKLKFSRPINIDVKPEQKINPKRLQRKIRDEVSGKGIGTKAQQAIQMEREAHKLEKKKFSKEQKEEMNEIRFEKKQEKKKEKKKGH